jgi:hypothetical protein
VRVLGVIHMPKQRGSRVREPEAHVRAERIVEPVWPQAFPLDDEVSPQQWREDVFGPDLPAEEPAGGQQGRSNARGHREAK